MIRKNELSARLVRRTHAGLGRWKSGGRLATCVSLACLAAYVDLKAAPSGQNARTDRVSSLKSFMQSPPVISEFVWQETGPSTPTHKRYSFLRWQTNALFYRDGKERGDLIKPRSMVGLDLIGYYETNYWSFQPNATNVITWVDEGQPDRDSSGGYGMYIRALIRASPAVNFGVLMVEPGGVVWAGESFKAVDVWGRKLEGALRVENETPVGLDYTVVGPDFARQDMGTTVTNFWTVQYAYSPTNSTALPDDVKIRAIVGGKSRFYRSFEIFSLMTTNALLPESVFSYEGFFNTNETVLQVEKARELYEVKGTNLVLIGRVPDTPEEREARRPWIVVAFLVVASIFLMIMLRFRART
ncbi:MAG: hypothetical protein ACI9VS_000446 [Candidatus Binatia bacterium]|jgi:hypothetical protein